MNQGQSSQDHAALWQRWYDEVWTGQKGDAVATMLAPDVQLHPGPGDATLSLSEFQAFHAQVLQKFSRVEGRVHDPIVFGDWVSVRTELTFVEHGKQDELRVFGLQRARVRGGQFVEVWDSWDWPSALEASGLIPEQSVARFLTSP